jgi:hypothetical protein
MRYQFAAAEQMRGRRPVLGYAWFALAAAIVLGPSPGICGDLQTSLHATLTVVDSGSLSVARVSGNTVTGASQLVAIHPRCSPTCIVFIDRDAGATGSPPPSPVGSPESKPEPVLVTPQTATTAQLALPAGSDHNAATVVIYF